MKNNTVDYVISELRVNGSSREKEVNTAIGELIVCIYGDKVNEEVVKWAIEMKKLIFSYTYEPFEYEDLL